MLKDETKKPITSVSKRISTEQVDENSLSGKKKAKRRFAWKGNGFTKCSKPCGGGNFLFNLFICI